MTFKSPFGFPPMDPSKMDPKLMMEISNLMRELPPGKLSEMQTLMHNMMAGFDVTGEMEAFERSLPPGFRERMTGIMMSQGTMPVEPIMPTSNEPPPPVLESEMDVVAARRTLLQAVANGSLTPEDAEKLLFPDS